METGLFVLIADGNGMDAGLGHGSGVTGEAFGDDFPGAVAVEGVQGQTGGVQDFAGEVFGLGGVVLDVDFLQHYGDGRFRGGFRGLGGRIVVRVPVAGMQAQQQERNQQKQQRDAADNRQESFLLLLLFLFVFHSSSPFVTIQ